MLKIVIPSNELWDERKNEFVYVKERHLSLEHSLVSISKWESKWNKPFLSKQEKTFEESIDYIRCMNLTQNIPSDDFNYLSDENLKEINAYIEAPMTASTVKEMPGPSSREQITSELIYYWMIAYNIPFECQKWHLNRLLILIQICNAKNRPPKRIGKNDLYRRQAAINARNRAKFHSKG